MPGHNAGSVFRWLTPSDEPFLWEMLYQAIYVPPHQPSPDRGLVNRPELARYVRGWGRVGDDGLAAVDWATDTLVGAAWLRLMVGPERGYGYIDDQTPELSVAVLPEYRGQEIGTRLIRRLLRAACTRYSAVSLSVSTENPARRLYERLGFEVVSSSGSSMTMKVDLLHRLSIERDNGDTR